MSLDATAREQVREITHRLKDTAGPLLPILHAVQDALGFIPPEAVPIIATGLNLSRAEVHGVVSFYHYFSDTPRGRHTIYLCRAESCQAMRAQELEQHVKARLGIDYHQTTASGTFSFEPVYCLGNCALSPAVMIDDRLYGRVTTERFDRMVSDWEKQ
jgi:formate dehydrogenase subunit gamma